MKKFLSLLLSLAMLLSVAALADETHGNYSDEMKIPYAVDLSPEDGADSVERAGDHVDSPYFSRLDFYNMTSTDTLTILPHFQTMQQTSEWSCGVVSALMDELVRQARRLQRADIGAAARHDWRQARRDQHEPNGGYL